MYALHDLSRCGARAPVGSQPRTARQAHPSMRCGCDGGGDDTSRLTVAAKLTVIDGAVTTVMLSARDSCDADKDARSHAAATTAALINATATSTIQLQTRMNYKVYPIVLHAPTVLLQWLYNSFPTTFIKLQHKSGD